ncbi:Hypothetical predicted protein [Mytilus galloprovincialis]|uniref:Uncharacterized protein n=1 Tax=Mytilus galloprovincialis TaxID=29158 RepID=A0A8B6E346_MYTGA|nr:Hypothetical predicted protein [Mytilus galloprovincialis]
MRIHGYQSPLQHPRVTKYFEEYLDVTKSFVRSLHSENLISDAQKDMILQTTPKDKARTSHNILIQNVTEEMRPILNKVLLDHKFETVERMMTFEFRIGHTVPYDISEYMHALTIGSNREESIDQMNENSEDVLSVKLSECNIFDTQPGCIHIFLHSMKPFYKELCNAENCIMYVTKCLENVKETLKHEQIIRVVIKKNAYSLPLKDGNGKIIEFSKTQVLQINRYFINGELKNAAQIFQKMFPDTKVFEMKDRQPTDILLDLVKGDSDKVWATFISLLQKFGNEAMANRLEKMICAECYRTTIINDLKNIAVEIDTDLMEETFKGKTVPKAVLDKCISTKGELPRVERAKYFLQYVLLKGEMTSAFADVLSSNTKMVLNFSPCETHGGKCEITSKDVDKEFTFQVCKNGTDHFTLTRPQEAEDILSKGSKSHRYGVQNVANKGLPNGNISGSLEDEQILSREDIVHKCGGKNGLSNLK